MNCWSKMLILSALCKLKRLLTSLWMYFEGSDFTLYYDFFLNSGKKASIYWPHRFQSIVLLWLKRELLPRYGSVITHQPNNDSTCNRGTVFLYGPDEKRCRQAIQELLEAVFSVRCVQRLFNEDQLPLRESFETTVRRVGVWCEMANSLRRREHGNRGTMLLNSGVKTVREHWCSCDSDLWSVVKSCLSVQ
jgi:hypothetical protein